ncbi:MAG: ABC transporter permease [Candidatus Nomurabacteria bacterium]|jgi:ABC-type Na+ efflux pump permease subunit|nr:ABC transporter permease [Candidatus Nomurabacteria bacterium]
MSKKLTLSSKLRNIALVAKREIITKMRNRTYIIGTLAVVVGIFLLAFLGSRSTAEDAGNAMIPEYAKQSIILQEQARQETLAEYNIDATELDTKIAARYQELLAAYQAEHPDSTATDTRYWIGFAVGILLFVALSITGSMIALGVAEEKSSRIVEILLSSMSSFELMFGKIVGMAVVGLTQIAIILGAGYIAAQSFSVMGDIFSSINLGAGIWLALGFFLVGYLSYATLYAAFAATVSRTEEVNVAIQPVMYIMMIPYFVVVIPALSNVAPLRFLVDYLPLMSPIGATSHYFQGELSLWQALLSLGISLAVLPFIMLAASRIYRRSVLSSGARLHALALLRQK